MFPTVAAYNNRAQAEIKLQNWHKALSDCQKVLEMEPANAKGKPLSARTGQKVPDSQKALDCSLLRLLDCSVLTTFIVVVRQ